MTPNKHMNDDLVQRLRNTQWYVLDGQLHDMCRGYNDDCREAANRIEALQTALREIADIYRDPAGRGANIARRALKLDR